MVQSPSTSSPPPNAPKWTITVTPTCHNTTPNCVSETASACATTACATKTLSNYYCAADHTETSTFETTPSRHTSRQLSHSSATIHKAVPAMLDSSSSDFEDDSSLDSCTDDD